MKKHKIAITFMVLSLVSAPVYAGVLDDTSKAVGSAIGSFGKGVVSGALPDSNVVVSDVTLEDSVLMDLEDTSNSRQAIQNIQVSDSELKYIQAHTTIRGDVLMTLDNCDDACYQAVTRILVKTNGAGLGGVYAKAAIEGVVRMKSGSSPGSEQYIHDIRIGSDSW